MQWACTDIVPPWKDTHNKLSLNTVKETFSSYSGVFEAGWGCSPRGGRCDTLSLGPVPHMATHCSSAHRTAELKKALPSPHVNHGTWREPKLVSSFVNSVYFILFHAFIYVLIWMLGR